MPKKYELTNETITFDGHTLYRIKACKDFTLDSGVIIKKGNLGGYVESEKNLSQAGNSWVFDNAKVFSKAEVIENAIAFGNAVVCDNSLLRGSAIVCNNAIVRESSHICDNAIIRDNAVVGNGVKVYGCADINANAYINEQYHFLSVGPIGNDENITFYHSKSGETFINSNWYIGPAENFFNSFWNLYPENLCYKEEYQLSIQLAKLHIEKDK